MTNSYSDQKMNTIQKRKEREMIMVTKPQLQEQIAKVVAEEPVSALVSMKARKYYGWKADLAWSQETPELRQLAWLLYKGYRWVECLRCKGNGTEPSYHGSRTSLQRIIRSGQYPCTDCKGDKGEWEQVKK